MKGIIFDFNGTMFLDSHLHEAAWLHMIHDHTKDGLSDDTKVKIKYSGYSLYCIKVSNINSKDIEKTIT
ncbi:hypothetical protein EfmGK961_00320 [Enterococcus faecium]|nr:hypothetical protein EfmGK961_00320 [Enterococcus faecium]